MSQQSAFAQIPKKTERVCSHCGAVYGENAAFCSSCGACTLGTAEKGGAKAAATADARGDMPFAPIDAGAAAQQMPSPRDEPIGERGADIFAAGLPMWNLTPPHSPVRRSRI